MILSTEDHRAIAVQVVELMALRASAPARSQYSIAEFSAICGLSIYALKRRQNWKRYGGIKRGRRVMFPESARLAIAEGKR